MSWSVVKGRVVDAGGSCVSAGKIVAEIKRLQDYRRYHEEMLTAYRLGRRPSERCLNELARLRMAEDEKARE